PAVRTLWYKNRCVHALRYTGPSVGSRPARRGTSASRRWLGRLATGSGGTPWRRECPVARRTRSVAVPGEGGLEVLGGRRVAGGGQCNVRWWGTICHHVLDSRARSCLTASIGFPRVGGIDGTRLRYEGRM